MLDLLFRPLCTSHVFVADVVGGTGKNTQNVCNMRALLLINVLCSTTTGNAVAVTADIVGAHPRPHKMRVI